MKTRVIIADDHPLILAGVRLLLSSTPNTEVVAEADSPDQLLSVLRATPCDLLITDFSMPGGQTSDGLSLLERIRRDFPTLPVIVLTMISNVGVHGTILQAGVQGLVDKAAGMAEISLAIQAVNQGRDYISESFRPGLLQSGFDAESGTSARLSPRELEVLRLFSSGLTVTEIAEKVARSVKTVSRQKTDAMSKLGLQNDYDVFVYARQHGLST